MQNKSFFRRSLLVGAGAFALGAASVGVVGSAIGAQDTTAPQEARPKMMAPNANLIQQLSFADLVEEVSPAVVSIRTETSVPLRKRMGLPPEFERMLPPEFRGGGDEEEEGTARAEGSGFFIDDQGHIVTNNHVVEGADSISVVLSSGEELEATLVGTDPSTDLAVLRVQPSSKQKFVRFSTDADLRVGDYVLAVGNPFGLGGSVTSGIVSAIGRENRGATPYADFIQIDASINRGNSGGPTFDLKGNVVGVNTAIISPTGGNVGIGLAVPADVASDIVGQLIADGSVTRGWLGVTIGDLDERLAGAVGLEEAKGALVAAVSEGSPAEKAGFKEGDVVLEFDRKPIESSAGLTRAVGALPPGKQVKAKVLRDGKTQSLNVTLAKRDPMEAREAGESVTPKGHDMKDLGVTFSSLSPQTREQMGFEDDVTGVLVTDVEKKSEAAEAGIRSGMLITRADNKNVSSPQDIEKAVEAAKARGKEAVLIRVQTPQRGAYFLALPVSGGGEDDDRG
ncbi:Do family serine endopeptidase [Parvularcula sp. LCG005]|uniref:Do family serine endopeptidase n=1 Tax=Parvularcula sp. LCG005 TaxID=3078805 RepID=UPI00397C27B5